MEESSPGNQLANNSPAKPLLIVLSGPSGVGKDAVLNRMRELNYPIHYVTTLTTRPKRAREKDGREYHFTSLEKFREMIEKKQLLEWAEVYGNLYGVPREAVKQPLEGGQDVIVKVDIQGAFTIKKLLPEAITIFLTPPTIDELFNRLTRRSTESPSEMELRLKIAEEEMKQLPLFDYAVVNSVGEIDQAVSEIEAIITAEKRRTTRREINL
jgi:guanylate kinase